MAEGNEPVESDAALAGRIESLVKVPTVYEVSKERRVDQVEDGEELEYLDVGMGDDP